MVYSPKFNKEYEKRLENVHKRLEANLKKSEEVSKEIDKNVKSNEKWANTKQIRCQQMETIIKNTKNPEVLAIAKRELHFLKTKFNDKANRK